jgi:hypothetical protein
MSYRGFTNVIELMFDGNGSGSALPSDEPLSPATGNRVIILTPTPVH